MIRFFVVTNVRLLSDLIQGACANQPDLEFVGTLTGKPEALRRARECDVMLVNHDIRDAISLTQELGRVSNPAVIVINVPNIEPLIIRYIEAGASGCIREQDSAQELLQSIRLAAAHQIALDAELYPLVLKRVFTLGRQQQSSAQPPESPRTLTHREREILQLIAQGYPNRAIAHQLTIEVGTTKNHIHNILDKLNVKTRRDAAVYYTLGLV